LRWWWIHSHSRSSGKPLTELILDLGLWIARHGGLIDTLEPVVDAIAQAANSTRDTEQLEALSHQIGRIIAAVPAVISQDLEKINPGRPWRVLLLNHSIVATRSHNTAVMEDAFALLSTRLPEDDARFFYRGHAADGRAGLPHPRPRGHGELPSQMDG
jgi:hypothetical protein